MYYMVWPSNGHLCGMDHSTSVVESLMVNGQDGQ